MPCRSSASSGRLLLIVAPVSEQEPRLMVAWDQDAVPFFGIDVSGWKPGEKKSIDGKAFGFPIRSIDDLPAGSYRVQAVLNRYETFVRSDGQRLELPPDQGEGQVWSRKPGNLYSKPLSLRIGGMTLRPVSIVLDQKIPAIERTRAIRWSSRTGIFPASLPAFARRRRIPT